LENQPFDLRTTLEAKLHTLKARHQRIDDHLHNRNGLPSDDWAERAVERENEEVVEALEPMTRREIDAIEAALDRLDHGEPLNCARCHEPIEPRRIALLPATPFCSECAS
jgi:RNA polymerase-binding transcription factor DksA